MTAALWLLGLAERCRLARRFHAVTFWQPDQHGHTRQPAGLRIPVPRSDIGQSMSACLESQIWTDDRSASLLTGISRKIGFSLLHGHALFYVGWAIFPPVHCNVSDVNTYFFHSGSVTLWLCVGRPDCCGCTFSPCNLGQISLFPWLRSSYCLCPWFLLFSGNLTLLDTGKPVNLIESS